MQNSPRLLLLAVALALAPTAGAQCNEVKTEGALGPGARFGASISVSGDALLVGAPGADSVVFHTWTGSNWTPVATFTEQAGSEYGRSVAVHGDVALVGAPRYDDLVGGTVDSGAVQLFLQGPPGTWTPAPLKLPPNPQDNGSYGWSVDTDGLQFAVGAPGQNANRGNVRLYEVVGGLLQQSQNIVAPTATVGPASRWGHDVAIDDRTLLVGAPLADVLGFTDNGVAYFYRRFSGTFIPRSPYTFGGSQTLQGLSVDVDGDRGVTQAQTFGTIQWMVWDGQGYVVEDESATFGQDKRGAVALCGARTIQGRPDVGPFLQDAPGVFQYFTMETPGDWGTRQAVVSLEDPTVEYASAVTIDGDLAVVGEPLDDAGGAESGAVFTYDVSKIAWQNNVESFATRIDGASGTLDMSVVGSVCSDAPIFVSLDNAERLSPTALVIGLSFLGAPFKGGLLGPNADFVLSGFMTDSNGELTLTGDLPSGLPDGVELFMQFLVVDAAAVKGIAASETTVSITSVPAP